MRQTAFSDETPTTRKRLFPLSAGPAQIDQFGQSIRAQGYRPTSTEDPSMAAPDSTTRLRGWGATSTTAAGTSWRAQGCSTGRTRSTRYWCPASSVRHALRKGQGRQAGAAPKYPKTNPGFAWCRESRVISAT